MTDSLAEQVDLFADLMVSIDDPFGDPTLAIAAAGVDADGYERLVASWRARFDGDTSGELAGRFADAYARRRTARAEQLTRGALGETPPADPRLLDADALGFREQAAGVGREVGAVPPALQAPIPAAGPVPHAPVPEPSPAATPLLPPLARVLRPPERVAGTADISAFVPRPATPFAPGSADPRPLDPRPAAPAHPRVDSGTTEMKAVDPHPLVPSGERSAAPAPVVLARPSQRLAGTADISAFVPRAATPFASASSDRPTPEPLPAAPARSRHDSGTSDISAAVPRHLLPFEGGTPPPVPPPPLVARPPQSVAGTADISAFVPGAATPFEPSPAPPPPAPAALADAAPRRRLIRFDPQTGQPLPVPVWVDLPPEPGQLK